MNDSIEDIGRLINSYISYFRYFTSFQIFPESQRIWELPRCRFMDHALLLHLNWWDKFVMITLMIILLLILFSSNQLSKNRNIDYNELFWVVFECVRHVFAIGSHHFWHSCIHEPLLMGARLVLGFNYLCNVTAELKCRDKFTRHYFILFYNNKIFNA